MNKQLEQLNCLALLFIAVSLLAVIAAYAAEVV